MTFRNQLNILNHNEKRKSIFRYQTIENVLLKKDFLLNIGPLYRNLENKKNDQINKTGEGGIEDLEPLVDIVFAKCTYQTSG